MKFHIPRSGDVDLVFDGVCLVDVSTYQPGKAYWTEIRIFRTNAGKYVAEAVGRSDAGDRDRRNVAVVDDPADLRTALKRRKRAPGEVSAKPAYLTDFAISALRLAATIDPRVAAATQERV